MAISGSDAEFIRANWDVAAKESAEKIYGSPGNKKRRINLQPNDPTNTLALIALASKNTFTNIKDTLWNKIKKLLGFGNWVYLRVQNMNPHAKTKTPIYIRANAASLRKRLGISKKEFARELKLHPDLNLTSIIRKRLAPSFER